MLPVGKIKMISLYFIVFYQEEGLPYFYDGK